MKISRLYGLVCSLQVIIFPFIGFSLSQYARNVLACILQRLVVIEVDIRNYQRFSDVVNKGITRNFIYILPLDGKI